MNYFGRTDTGVRRTNNEDSYFCQEHVGMFDWLFMVADGMGGHSFGEVASSLAVSSVVDYVRNAELNMPGYILEQAISIANLNVRKESLNLHSRGMGTTLVIAGLVGNQVYIANVGDSRLYQISPQNFSITQITKDHSYVDELLEKGIITKDSPIYHEKKNVITRAIGVYAEVEADLFECTLKDRDLLLLCTDGLNNMVDDVVIKNLALDDSFTIDRRVDTLIQTANSRGGKDNITVVLYEHKEESNA